MPRIRTGQILRKKLALTQIHFSRFFSTRTKIYIQTTLLGTKINSFVSSTVVPSVLSSISLRAVLIFPFEFVEPRKRYRQRRRAENNSRGKIGAARSLSSIHKTDDLYKNFPILIHRKCVTAFHYVELKLICSP